jgi:hypothetical protein
VDDRKAFQKTMITKENIAKTELDQQVATRNESKSGLDGLTHNVVLSPVSPNIYDSDQFV